MYVVDFIRYSSKIFWKVLSMYVVEFIEMRHLAWMGAGQTHIRIRSNWKRTKNPASKGPDCGWAHTISTFIDGSFELCNITGGESLYGWGKSKADIWCCRQLEKPTPGWQAEPKGWSLISKFAQNNQHSIRGAVRRKSGWKLDFWYEKHTSKSIQWLELKIQICPKPPTHYSESHLKQVRLLNGWKGSSMRCSRFPCCFFLLLHIYL